MEPNQQPPASSYVLAIAAIVVGVLVIPIVWSIFKGIVKIAAIIALALLVLYGISLLAKKKP